MNYYARKLSGRRLAECYEIAPPRVKRYLESEIAHVKSRLHSGDTVLELGCGYGRVVFELARVARKIVGIDTASESIALARQLGADIPNCEFFEMDAIDLKLLDNSFDVVICVQNGICAFGVDRERLMMEALRVTRPNGRVLFSSYDVRFWKHRLEWFALQAARGLVGEIDYQRSGDNVIVCKDGFTVGAMDEKGFLELCDKFGIVPAISEVDESSIFCEVIKPAI
jgi:2-polyprenyl-6-hydroxyphenyl methylase/3-demethylubiquinone-9 3-methyltransferase